MLHSSCISQPGASETWLKVLPAARDDRDQVWACFACCCTSTTVAGTAASLASHPNSSMYRPTAPSEEKSLSSYSGVAFQNVAPQSSPSSMTTAELPGAPSRTPQPRSGRSITTARPAISMTQSSILIKGSGPNQIAASALGFAAFTDRLSLLRQQACCLNDLRSAGLCSVDDYGIINRLLGLGYSVQVCRQHAAQPVACLAGLFLARY